MKVTTELPLLAEFDQHKETILKLLRNVYKRGPKSNPFDGDKAWRRLTGFARFYLGRGSEKQEAMPAADRIERLRDIAKILSRARRLIDRTMQNEAGDELFSAWWEGAGSEYAKADGSFDPRYMERKFKKVVKGLAVLETAASYGADHVAPPKRGRPPVLSWDDILNLAALYRENTGLIPGAGEGPFADFVVEVVTALGRYNHDEGKRVNGKITFLSLVDAIKATREWALTHPAVRKWGPSPFDEVEKLSDEEQKIISALERSWGRKLTEQEIYLSLGLVRGIGEL